MRTTSARPRVVIVGAGFGGLEAAKSLADLPVDVVLVDRSNHHLFQPLLYQVATAGLSPAEIAIPVRSVLRRSKNVRVVMAAVTDIRVAEREVHLDDGAVIGYDYFILAAGARASYFGHDTWAEHTVPLKSVDDATRLRRDVLLAFERADRIEEPERRRRELTFVVIGGGPTGVELAGALIELTRRVLTTDFPRVDPGEPRVVLVEGADRLLGGMSEESSAVARRSLEEMGVEVRTSSMAQNIDERGVHLEDGVIEADTVVWAAGVSASPLAERLGVELERGGRVIVERDCSVPGHPEVFAVGDIAAYRTESGLLPGVSPVAMQQGRHVAECIRRRLEGRPTESFRYLDKGTMATIGRSRAVAEVGGMKLRGLPAWFAWLFVHLWFLVGFKNRVFVFLQWVFSYALYRRGARLITRVEYGAEARRRRRRLREASGTHDKDEAA